MANDSGRPRERAGEQAIDNLSATFGASLEAALNKAWRSNENRYQQQMQKFGQDMQSMQQKLASGMSVRSVARDAGIDRSVLQDYTAGRGYASSVNVASGGNRPQQAQSAIPDSLAKALQYGVDVSTGRRPDATGHVQPQVSLDILNQQKQILSASRNRIEATTGVAGAAPKSAVDSARVFAEAFRDSGGALNAAARATRRMTPDQGQVAAEAARARTEAARAQTEAAQVVSEQHSTNWRRFNAISHGINVIGSTPQSVQGTNSLIAQGAGALLGGVVGSVVPGIGTTMGALAGSQLFGSLFGAYNEHQKQAISKYTELSGSMSIAAPDLAFRQSAAMLGRAGGFDPYGFTNHLRSKEGNDWLKLYGGDAQGAVDRIGQVGVTPRSAEESTRMAKFLYGQEGSQAFAGMPQGTVEELMRTITSTGMTGGRMTEGNKVLSEQYFQKFGDVMAIAQQKGMDKASVLQSINEGVQKSSSGNVADSGMIDLLTKITQSGMAGAGTGVSQRETAEGISKSWSNAQTNPAIWQTLGKTMMGINSDESFQKATGVDPKTMNAAQRHGLELAYSEPNQYVKMKILTGLIPASSGFKMEMSGLENGPYGPHGSHPMTPAERINALANQNNISFAQAQALVDNQGDPTLAHQQALQQKFTEMNISPEAQKYALGETAKRDNLQEPLAATLQASPEFQSASDDKRQEISDRLEKALKESIDKAGGAPTPGAFQAVLGDRYGQLAFENNERLRGQDTGANATQTDVQQILLTRSSEALSEFVSKLIEANKRLGEFGLYGSPPTLTPPVPAARGLTAPTLVDPKTGAFIAPIAPGSATTGAPTTSDGSPPTFMPPTPANRGLTAPTIGPQGSTGDLTSRVMAAESGGNPNAVSSKGAVGTMQTMPSTLTDPGYGVTPASNPNDPKERERVGKDYLAAMQKKYGNDRDALIAYNWGPGNADKWIANGRNASDLPRETSNYVSKILAPQGPGGMRGGDVTGRTLSKINEQRQAQGLPPVTSISGAASTNPFDSSNAASLAPSFGGDYGSGSNVTIGPPTTGSSSGDKQSNNNDYDQGPDTASLVAFNTALSSTAQALGGFANKVGTHQKTMRPTAADTNLNVYKVSL